MAGLSRLPIERGGLHALRRLIELAVPTHCDRALSCPAGEPGRDSSATPPGSCAAVRGGSSVGTALARGRPRGTPTAPGLDAARVTFEPSSSRPGGREQLESGLADVTPCRTSSVNDVSLAGPARACCDSGSRPVGRGDGSHVTVHQVGARLPAAEDPMSLSVLPPTLR